MLDVKPRDRPDSFTAPRSSQGRRDGRPNVSVVSLADDDAPGTLRNAMERGARWERLGVELIVVCGSRRATRSAAAAITGARVVYGPVGASDQQLRALGLAAATGDVILLVDDPATADDSWIEYVSVIGRCANEHAGQ